MPPALVDVAGIPLKDLEALESKETGDLAAFVAEWYEEVMSNDGIKQQKKAMKRMLPSLELACRTRATLLMKAAAATASRDDKADLEKAAQEATGVADAVSDLLNQ